MSEVEAIDVLKSERDHFHAKYIDKARECVSLKARLTEAEQPRGTKACPICGVDSPHSHEPSEIQKWVQNQAARFGYKAVAYVPPATTDDFISQTVQSLREERANGNKPESLHELGSYPDSLIDDAIEAIELLQLDSRPDAGTGPSDEVRAAAYAQEYVDLNDDNTHRNCAFMAFLAGIRAVRAVHRDVPRLAGGA